MSSNTDTKLDPAEEQVASSEPKLAQQETELVTNPKGPQEESATGDGEHPSYTQMATSAASGVKDNVFSMFGGGAKKEKKEEPEDDTNEPSGSSKAKKDAEADAEVKSRPLARTHA